MTVDQRVEALRKEMKNNGLDAYIIPSSDPHQSEYVADCWKSREWISGFSGSAGVAVVTNDHAGVWTDSRYFLQGEEELADSCYQLHKVYDQFAPQHINWLKDNLNKGSVVGIDAWMFSKNQVQYLKNSLSEKGIELNTNHDLLNAIWSDRAALPHNMAFEHELKFAGESRAEKIAKLRQNLDQNTADYTVLTMLDDIAWTLNVRSSDVEYNPVCISYLIIGTSDVIWFVDEEKLDTNLKNTLSNDGIILKPYSNIISYLSSIAIEKTVLLDKSTCNQAMYQALKCTIKHQSSHAMHLKAIKNDVEIGHWKNCMVKDGVALLKLIMWLRAELENREVSEAELAERLAGFRAEQAYYFGESFGAIVGYAGNGAIIHYHPTHEKCSMIKKEDILLLDSGGQYFDGTTDITRTFALGAPTQEQIDNYTRVLQGHIALNRLQFPEGTMGVQMDVLARQPLWQAGLNYLHGTGHGVGFFMNVHEPPQGFTAGTSSRGVSVIKEGMVTTNEPGFYKDGAYGIRIENCELVVKSADEGFLKHEHITVFPMERELINQDMLSPADKEWLNTYHQLVWDRLSPHLDTAEQKWLEDRCRAI